MFIMEDTETILMCFMTPRCCSWQNWSREDSLQDRWGGFRFGPVWWRGRVWAIDWGRWRKLRWAERDKVWEEWARKAIIFCGPGVPGHNIQLLLNMFLQWYWYSLWQNIICAQACTLDKITSIRWGLSQWCLNQIRSVWGFYRYYCFTVISFVAPIRPQPGTIHTN